MELMYNYFSNYLYHSTSIRGNNAFYRNRTEQFQEESYANPVVKDSNGKCLQPNILSTKFLNDGSELGPAVPVPNLPTYSKAEVQAHNSKGTRIWTSLSAGVYDITDFIAKHPGGAKRILLASGNALEPFFELCPVHFRKDNVSILEHFRIGNLKPEDKFNLSIIPNSWTDEPQRDPNVIVHSYEPFTCESPLKILPDNFFTPNALFFVRNHYPIPKISLKSYKLHVEGIKLTSTTFTMHQLQTKFKRTDVNGTIQCAGNRQAEQMAIRPVGGKSWSGGGIGNAKWSGVKLKDVLIAVGFKKENYELIDKFHIEFEGLDKDQTCDGYACSIPLFYILDDNFDCILAYEMNGEVLPLDHGYPLRVFLPGIVGARHVKWLGEIRLIDHESTSPWQRKDNKIFREPVTWNSIDYNSVPSIYDVPVTSFICSHKSGDVVKVGQKSTIRGYAYSGGGRSILRVDISIDNGRTWNKANITNPKKLSQHSCWSWTIWEAELNVTEVGLLNICIRATDSAWNNQPEDLKPLWNYRGYLTNSWHKIKLEALVFDDKQ